MKQVCASKPWSKLAINAPAHFERLYTGQPTMPRTPLYKAEPVPKVVNTWARQLEKFSKEFPQTVEYDLSKTSKVGARGGYPPWTVMEPILEKYATRLKVPDLTNPLLQQAIELTREQLHIGQFTGHRPLSPKSVLKRDIKEDKVNSNSGAPDYSRRDRSEVQQNSVRDAENGTWETLPYIIAERTQRYHKVDAGKPQGGTRFIFMAPQSVNLKEKGYILPLFDYLRNGKHPEFLAWEGFDEVETYGPDANDTEYVSTDFTGMDQTVGPMQLEILFKVFRDTFQNESDMRRVLSYCLHAPIQITYDSAWCPKVHALPSGAGGTNFYETILATVMHNLAGLIQGQPHRFQVLGDDGIAFGSVGLKDALVAAATMMGFEMNPEKQRTTHSGDPKGGSYVYLQRFFCPKELKGLGAYPTILALNACIHPERFMDPTKWSAKMESLRWIMILENCKHHPAFAEFVEYVRKGDKYQLDLGPKPEAVYRQAKTIPGFVPSYNQASLDRGINDFEVMKLLRQ